MGNYSLVVVHGFLFVMTFLVEHGLLSAWASVVVAHELSCPVTYGIFPDQDLPKIKLVSSALVGGLLTTGPPGKSYPFFLFRIPILSHCCMSNTRLNLLV